RTCTSPRSATWAARSGPPCSSRHPFFRGRRRCSMADVRGTGTVTLDPRRWWVPALLGALSIAAGVLALAYPDITLLALGLIVGINLILIGATWTALATVEPGHSEGGRILRFFVGFLASLAGLICLVRPGAGVLALLLALSFWFILTGMSDLARAMEEH